MASLAVLVGLAFGTVTPPQALAAATYSISGTVTLPAGSPALWMKGVQVYLINDQGTYVAGGPVDATTGAYVIPNVTPGTYYVQFSAGAFTDPANGDWLYPNVYGVYFGGKTDRSSSTAIKVSSANLTAVNQALPEARTISGKVTLPAGAPAAWLNGIGVWATNGDDYSYVEVNPSTGLYTLLGLAPGAYEVNFEVRSYYDQASEVTVAPNIVPEVYNNVAAGGAPTLVNVASTDATGINAAMDLGRTISGKVSLPAGVTWTAVPGMSVNAFSADGRFGGSVNVDTATGQYTLKGLPAGEYDLFYMPWSTYDSTKGEYVYAVAGMFYGNTSVPSKAKPVSVANGNAANVNVTMSKGVSLAGKVTLPAGVPASWLEAVEVSVVDPTTGDGIAEAWVNASTGAYAIPRLMPGDFKVRFSAGGIDGVGPGGSDYRYDVNLMDEYYLDAGALDQATTVTVGSSGRAGINATLDKGGLLAGTVTGLSNDVDYCWSVTTVTGEYVADRGCESRSANGSTLPAGANEFSIGGLEPGTYRIHVHDWNTGAQQFLTSTSGATSFTVTKGQAVTGLKLVAAPMTSSITGTMTASGFTGLSLPWRNTDYLADVVAYQKLGSSWVRLPESPDVATTNEMLGYTIPGLVAGTYTVGFEKSQTPFTANGALAEQWFGGSSTLAGAASFTLAAGQTRTGVNGAVSPKSAASFSATGAPAVTGSYVVGSTLKVSAGAWSPAPNSYTVQWFRDGVPIAGATKSAYVITGADGGKRLSVAVTGWRNGYRAVTMSTARVAVPLASFAAAPTPTVSGTAAVGYVLTAVPGTWSPAPDSFTYQWFRNGVAISGAKSAQYTVAAADAGQQLSVMATGIKTGYQSTSRSSSRVSVPWQTFTTAPTPTITGTLAAGSKVTVNLGSWSPKPDTLTYQWYRDGVAISGAKYYQYTLATADSGHQISVAVTASKPGYKSVTKASTRVNIANLSD